MKTTALVAVLGMLTLTAAESRSQGFKARDLQGIRLGMTPHDVEVATHVRLVPLGRGDFKMGFNQTVFNLGFTPLGHLYRIPSDQTLGVFSRIKSSPQSSLAS